MKRIQTKQDLMDKLSDLTTEELAEELVNDCCHSDFRAKLSDAVIMASKVLEDISEVKPDKIGGYVFIKGKRHNEGIKLPLINSKAGSATGNIRNMFYNTKEVPGVETLRKMTKEEVVKTMVQLHVENTKLQTSRQSYALESSYLNRRIDMLEARLDYSAAVLGLRSWSKMKTRRQRVGQKYKAEREKLKKIK